MRVSEEIPSIVVCNGCCCGRVEKGHNEVPLNDLKAAWKKYDLEKNVKLTISDCLGPCSMHNVTLFKNKGKKTWIGKLNGEENYGALVEWACDISRYGDNAKLPDLLVPHCFIPKEIQ